MCAHFIEEFSEPFAQISICAIFRIYTESLPMDLIEFTRTDFSGFYRFANGNRIRSNRAH